MKKSVYALVVVMLALPMSSISYGAISSLHESHLSEVDFETALGKGTSSWQHIKTEEDLQRVKLFSSLFKKNVALLQAPGHDEKIPKEIHLIWLGPTPFPGASAERVANWMRLHSTWKLHVWTDQPQLKNFPLPSFCKYTLHKIEELSLFSLEEIFAAAVNFGEKARLLSYALLYQRGGVYIDHDVTLKAPLDGLHEHVDFYCQLEPLAPTIFSTTVLGGPHLMGASLGHPILAETISQICKRHTRVEDMFLTSPQRSYLTPLSLHRSVWPFSLALSSAIDLPGQIDIVLPPGLYALHSHEGTWKETEQRFEEAHKKQLQAALAKQKGALRWMYLTSILTVIAPLIVCVASWKSKGRKSKKEKSV